MATIAGNKNNFNNLLYKTQRNVDMTNSINRAARIPMDLSYKGENPVDKIINSGAAQLNGKHGDIKYRPDTEKHSRPNYGYDARTDPTILNAIRNKYVDVSGLLIPNHALPKNGKDTINMTQRPLQPYGIIH
jgi:hypothetical protein